MENAFDSLGGQRATLGMSTAEVPGSERNNKGRKKKNGILAATHAAFLGI